MRLISNVLLLAVTLSIAGCVMNNKSTVVRDAAPDSARQFINEHKTPISIENYEAFTRDMGPALEKMAACKIVGLGEGTHGTGEFQTVRAFITRYLIEEKGFNMVCLENSYGWCISLNQYVQTGEGNLDTIMRSNLLGMWQNEETRSLLQWIKDYNQKHDKKILLSGMDYSCILPNANIISSITRTQHNTKLDSLTDQLITRCRYMDNAYADLNNHSKKFKWEDILKNGVTGYELIQEIKSELKVRTAMSNADLMQLNTVLTNTEMAFYSIYKPVKEKKEASRDQSMADMVKLMADNNHDAKIIVLAHHAHLSKKKIFDDGSNGGGTGSFLESYFPQRYFAFGTGTAGGTFSATNDHVILNTSRFTSYSLPAFANSSWEQKIAAQDNRNLYIDCTNKNIALPELKLRFTGYGPSNGKDFAKVRLNELFDGFIFVPDSHATNIRK